MSAGEPREPLSRASATSRRTTAISFPESIAVLLELRHILADAAPDVPLMRATGPRARGRRDDAVRRPDHVPGVQLRLVDDDGAPYHARDEEAIGEIEVRGPNLFLGYLNRDDSTSAALHDGWFATGDMATRDSDGSIRIVGRRATDLIPSHRPDQTRRIQDRSGRD